MAINYRKFYNSLDFDERVAFRDLTISLMLEIYPHYIIRPLEPGNPDVIFITNKQDNVRIHFPLHDLYAHFTPTGKTRADLKETLLFHYADTLKMAEDAEVIRDDSKITWSDARNYVRPRFVRREELGDESLYITYPFGEEVLTTFVIDDRKDEFLVTRISKKMFERWNIEEKELIDKAMDNFASMTDGMEIHGTEPPHGYLFTKTNQELASTMILIGGFRHMIAKTLGSPFRFGIPSRYILYGWGELKDEGFQIEMKAMMEREFERMPSKLTTKIYEVDENGQIKQLKNQPEIKSPPNVNYN